MLPTPPYDYENGSSIISAEIEYVGQIAYNVVAPVIIIFGVLSNVINLLVLSRPTLRGPTFRYLKWLAVANLLVCVILLPFAFHSRDTPVPYLAAFYLAHVEIPIGNALMAASVYIVVGLSIDRFVAVCYPRKYRNLYSHYVASVRIAMSFVVAFIIYIPMMVFHQRVVQADGYPGLYLPKDWKDVRDSPLFIAYACLLELCARLAPALMLAYLNSRIIIEFKKISARRKLMHGMGCSEISGHPSISANEMSQAAPQADTPVQHVTVQYEMTPQKHLQQSFKTPSGLNGSVCNEMNQRNGSTVHCERIPISDSNYLQKEAAHHSCDQIDSSAVHGHYTFDCCGKPAGLLETDLDAVESFQQSSHNQHNILEAPRSCFSGINSEIGENTNENLPLKSLQNVTLTVPPTICQPSLEEGDSTHHFETPNISTIHLTSNLQEHAASHSSSAAYSPVCQDSDKRLEFDAAHLETKIDDVCEGKCPNVLHDQPPMYRVEQVRAENEGVVVDSSVRNHQMSSSAIRKGERRHDRERRLVLLLVSIIVTFFITNIPSAILSIITYRDSHRANLGFQIFRAVANNLEFLNYGLSFLLYFLFSKDIRGVFVSLLKNAIKSLGRTLSRGGGRSSSGRASANL